MNHNPFKSRVLEAYGVKRARRLAAQMPDIPYTTLLSYLNQTVEAPYEVLQRFARETGKSIDWLLTGMENDDWFNCKVIKKLDGSHVPLTESLKQQILDLLDSQPEKADP